MTVAFDTGMEKERIDRAFPSIHSLLVVVFLPPPPKKNFISNLIHIDLFKGIVACADTLDGVGEFDSY